VGSIYLKGRSHRYYIRVSKDAFDGAVCLRLAESRRMDEVLWFLRECWKDLGIPEQVQFDNGRRHLTAYLNGHVLKRWPYKLLNA
jgi:hypothetical protein